MFSHVVLGSNDLDRSRRFYDAILAATGGAPGVVDPKGRLAYSHRGGRLIIGRPIDNNPATSANGFTLGFLMQDAAEADRWHQAGLDHGGTTLEDPPGERQGIMGPIYLAYLRDPDGNKLCALHMA